jgi:hypothetical protein
MHRPECSPSSTSGPAGRERFGFKMDGTTFRYDARYYDIVPDQRISVSVSSL